MKKNFKVKIKNIICSALYVLYIYLKRSWHFVTPHLTPLSPEYLTWLGGILFVLKTRKSAAETELIILTPKKIWLIWKSEQDCSCAGRKHDR